MKLFARKSSDPLEDVASKEFIAQNKEEVLALLKNKGRSTTVLSGLIDLKGIQAYPFSVTLLSLVSNDSLTPFGIETIWNAAVDKVRSKYYGNEDVSAMEVLSDLLWNNNTFKESFVKPRLPNGIKIEGMPKEWIREILGDLANPYNLSLL